MKPTDMNQILPLYEYGSRCSQGYWTQRYCSAILFLQLIPLSEYRRGSHGIQTQELQTGTPQQT